MHESYDVIVVGGGHAGAEAAAAAARMGARTALVTMRADQIGAMSCNPAIGGLGKGHLVREIDAFDGIMARAADAGAIHYRMLNLSKGAAVQGPRVQADRKRFRAEVQRLVAAQTGLFTIEGEVASLQLDGRTIAGVQLADGRALSARSVVLATGTFLNGKLHFGMQPCAGGRVGEAASTALAEQLRAADLPMARLKTGTPPRLDGRTIDWARLEMQPSDSAQWTFAAFQQGRPLPQIACGITRTNVTTHRIIRDGLDRSPLYAGAIEGRGPRYCPSIEDKVMRFGDREGHQIFLEPEGLDDNIVYPNGISTSLPLDVQQALVNSIDGLEQARIVQPGYAVEYDHIDPRALDPTLALWLIPGLFCAGQINGTTGYEEAAAQGLVAGINAAAFAQDRPPVLFDRAESYIGVMIDDLTLHGVTEPYRMLTARAEYRLRLRADNALTRLAPKAVELGVVGEAFRQNYVSRETQRKSGRAILDGRKVQGRSLFDWLCFPDFDVGRMFEAAPDLRDFSPDVIDELVQDGRYAPYVERQNREVARMRNDENVPLPVDIDYRAIGGLSNEMIERLEAARPMTLGAAGRVRGITPAALAAILIHSRRRAA